MGRCWCSLRLVAGIRVVAKHFGEMRYIACEHVGRDDDLFWPLLEILVIGVLHRSPDPIANGIGGYGETDIGERLVKLSCDMVRQSSLPESGTPHRRIVKFQAA